MHSLKKLLCDNWGLASSRFVYERPSLNVFSSYTGGLFARKNSVLGIVVESALFSLVLHRVLVTKRLLRSFVTHSYFVFLVLCFLFPLCAAFTLIEYGSVAFRWIKLAEQG